MGISHGNVHYQTCKKDENYLKIAGILAAHAILYVTDIYRKNMSEVGKHCLYNMNVPWDLGTANIQHHFNVYTPNSPMIYQSNDRENANKWQVLTDHPLDNKNNLTL